MIATYDHVVRQTYNKVKKSDWTQISTHEEHPVHNYSLSFSKRSNYAQTKTNST